jgi:hypothetical protein
VLRYVSYYNWLDIALLSCASVEGAYCLLLYLHVQVSSGHTVCCLPSCASGKCRVGILFVAYLHVQVASVEWAYCLLLYLHVQVASVEWAYCLLLYLHVQVASVEGA